MKKVSIITVCLNSAATIRDTMESIVSQDYPNIEHIVIDGGSTDGTIEIVNEYLDHVATFISETDSGLYDAMNKGIQNSSGEIVGSLNADDIYFDNSAITRLMAKMTSAGTDSVFADLVIVDRWKIDRIIRYYDSSRFSRKRLKYGWMPAHPTFLCNRECYQNYGLYSLDYKIAADYELIARFLYSKKVSYTYLPLPVVKMRAGGISTKGIKSSWLLNREIVKACSENGIKTSMAILALKVPKKLLQLRPSRFIDRLNRTDL